jgi:hypothetical protein
VRTRGERLPASWPRGWYATARSASCRRPWPLSVRTAFPRGVSDALPALTAGWGAACLRTAPVHQFGECSREVVRAVEFPGGAAPCRRRASVGRRQATTAPAPRGTVRAGITVVRKYRRAGRTTTSRTSRDHDGLNRRAGNNEEGHGTGGGTRSDHTAGPCGGRVVSVGLPLAGSRNDCKPGEEFGGDHGTGLVAPHGYR